MARQLRPRKAKQNYAELAGEAVPGPSDAIEEADESGSDFSPDQDAEGVPDDEYEDDVVEDVVAEEEEVVVVPSVKSKGKGKAKATPKPKKQPSTAISVGPATSSRRQMYTLPTPSVHHRHRATPLFAPAGKVERLTAEPPLFGSPRTVLTNNFTHNNLIADRVNRAWGYNVGSGPLWQLAEDRRWFKEGDPNSGLEDEAKRRPRVYDGVPVRAGWKVLNQQDGAGYLPTANETTEEGTFKPPPPVPCYFGPVGSQTLRNLETTDSVALSEYIPGSRAHVFNAGAPVWAVDWCPIHASDRPARSFKQYLAVAPFPNSSHSPDIGVKATRPSPACIQIWSLAPTNPVLEGASAPAEDVGAVKCEIILCIDNGPALDMKWCPLPSHDPIKSTKKIRKLGLLGGTFEDGSFCIYVVPDPATLGQGDAPHIVQIDPILRIDLPETACWSFDWANSDRIAIGTTHGVIAVYDVGGHISRFDDPALPTITKIRPTHYLSVHQSAVRALAWIQAPPCDPSGSPALTESPTVIASGGYDGVECLTDIREGRGSIMNRTRDVINTLTYSPFAAGPITMDHENTVKSYAASPSMLGRGHTLLEPMGPVWNAYASEYHPQLAVAAADGSCSTTNTLRSPRRGGTVPFFVHKIYQMDYSRKSKEFRMLDCFLPQEVPDARSAVSNSKKAKTAEAPSSTSSGTGAWSKHVGVHRVTWNNGNGLSSSCLLASATASGLCRIDVLWGRWIKDKAPYGGVEYVRLEDGEAMDVDSDLSELESLSDG